MTQIHDIPVHQIDPDALPRDRTVQDADADHELYHSILRDGQRQPIEVWAFPTPRGDFHYGLISGYRRLATVAQLAALPSHAGTVAALIRNPDSIPDAMAAMVAENEIRAQISPWDRARIIIDAVEEGIFDTHDAAIKALHPVMPPAKRRRLRATVQVVDVFWETFPDPHSLSERKLLRLAAVLRADLEELVFKAVARHRPGSTAQVWALIAPILAEAEHELANPPPPRAPGRPRRLMSPHKDLQIRREFRPDGWVLIFTGNRASEMLVETVMDEIELMLGPG